MAMECLYGRCLLPKNNHRYLWQLAYIVIGLCVLLLSTESFNFFQLFLFIAPVLVDLLNTDLSTPTLRKVRIIFSILNAVILVCCFLGWSGIILDKGDYFSVAESFMFFAKMSIKKQYVGAIIAVNTIVPIIFWIGAPCQNAQRILKQKQQILQQGQQSKPKVQQGRGKKRQRK